MRPRRFPLLLLVLATVGAAPCLAGRSREAALQMRFGARMAQQGAWKEAEFRFQRAAQLAPGDPEILNNLAVAYENNGRYDEAEAAYREALEAAPEDRHIRENYERFRVFFAEYQRQEERGAATGSAEPDAPPGTGADP